MTIPIPGLYEPLNMRRNQIRPLYYEEFWRVMNFDVQKRPLCAAISYMWGSAADTATFKLNDHDVVVRQNLSQVLQLLLHQMRTCKRPREFALLDVIEAIHLPYNEWWDWALIDDVDFFWVETICIN